VTPSAYRAWGTFLRQNAALNEQSVALSTLLAMRDEEGLRPGALHTIWFRLVGYQFVSLALAAVALTLERLFIASPWAQVTGW
jgi:hypothetical protein